MQLASAPHIVPLRSGGPNKPYEVLGQRYTPLAADVPLQQTGLASWYGRKFHGRPTASGEVFDMFAFSAAHRTMPIPSYALVRNPANGRELVVRVNDRGPFHAERIIDLSYAAALRLDLQRGVAPVEVRRLTHDDIRSGRWRGVPQAPDDFTAADAAAAVPDKSQAGGWWVQLGAFRQREGAHGLRQTLAREQSWLEPWLAIFDEQALFRVQAGPFASRAEAQGAAERIAGAAALQPVLVQRR
jgi:rare lipoprotein A